MRRRIKGYEGTVVLLYYIGHELMLEEYEGLESLSERIGQLDSPEFRNTYNFFPKKRVCFFNYKGEKGYDLSKITGFGLENFTKEDGVYEEG